MRCKQYTHFARFHTHRVFSCLWHKFSSSHCSVCVQYIHDLDLFVTVQILEDTAAVLSLINLCEEHGYSYDLASGQKPQLKTSGRRTQCHTENFVPIVVPGLSTSSSSSSASTSPTSLQQDTSDDTASSPATTRSDDTSIPSSGNRSRALPQWWQNSQNIGKTKECQHQGKTSQDSDSERPTKLVSKSRKHSVFTHLPTDRNCEICLRTKMTRAPCRRRTGEAVPQAEKIGDVVTADHEVLNERVNHGTITGTQSWYKARLLNGYNHTREKDFSSRQTSQESFILTIHPSLVKLLKN